MEADVDSVIKQIHRTIANVTDDFDNFRFNRAIARVRELTNTIASMEGETREQNWARRFGYETVVQLIAPVMPHLAEELWWELGNTDLLATRSWPKADKALLVEAQVTMAIQINGKFRGTLKMAVDTDTELVREQALKLESVLRVTKGTKPQKVIVVPNKVINVVL